MNNAKYFGCTVEGCTEQHHAKGMCKLHYQRKWLTGSPVVGRPCLHRPVEEKFWFYVDKKDGQECWMWTGHKDKDGYGRLRDGKKNMVASRISWEIHNGASPKGSLVLHKCNTPSCVNPGHLYVGNQTQNMKDRADAGNTPCGENHSNCKVSDSVVDAIRSDNRIYRLIAKDYGISQSQVGNIKRGTQRK